MARAPRQGGRIRIRVNFSAFPVQASLGALGRKWAFLILMHVALGRTQRFNELLRKTPGMSKRILAMRLRELERSGYLVRAEQRQGYTRWQLTSKGTDVLPVLLTLIHFASKWREPNESEKGTKSSLGQTFDIDYGSSERKPAPRRR